MKKGLALAMALMMAAVTLGGAMAAEGAINVISREDGSGTRGGDR